ncbi:MAG: sigma factor, partial [Gammaproteobacteria bacterium]
QLVAPIRRYLRRYCGDPDIAEDVLQDTLLRIDRALPGFDGRARLETWALAIATRAAADHFRAATRQPPSLQWSESANTDNLTDDRSVEDRLWTSRACPCRCQGIGEQPTEAADRAVPHRLPQQPALLALLALQASSQAVRSASKA